MAMNSPPCDHADEEYIDMEVGSSAFFCYSVNSPPHPREFEFHMSSLTPIDREPTTSPADELFYKGKLLPLHLPPRLQMVQKLLQHSNTHFEENTEALDENYTTPFSTTTPTPTTATPFESCNISPSESCRVSRELNPDEYFVECCTDANGFISDQPKKSWSKKLKLIKSSSLGLKLKASRAYLKSLFSKSGCSDESSAEAARNGDEGTISKAKECLNRYIKVSRKNPFGQIQKGRCQNAATVMRGFDKEKIIEDGSGGDTGHRRSFSGAIKWHSTIKSSSSTSSSGSSSSSSLSSNSNGHYGVQLLKRSSSANSEIESSIQGAIAHCKQSQKLFGSRNAMSEVGFCSLSASRIGVCEEQERPALCRG
ncbi:PREDICTED: probable membrane-associated kinase regulator 4 [Nelumbo nucifera]|uniref:Membrane-associated kinase regulator 4 n=2 Tax=Nelumbo nucifera TaxID=4432 RepID=A0A822Y0I8_NELNU|nr:PREDICTED: probable membrane-associated kinase regulator 4 [Nelumbo nucifera]DAD25967.1 TPA_asm: hypothetical protein HUJ06_027435 [Nelumbo nucifera]